MSDLSLWLDSYDDIFSDFDSRHYLKRRISEDFIEELHASLKYRSENFDGLMLLLPAAQRMPQAEQEILSSIKEQLQVRLNIILRRAGRIRSRGFAMLVSGVCIMVVDSIIAYKMRTTYLSTLVRVFMEPAGWFMIWNGLELLIDKYRSVMKEGYFYERTGQLSFHFKDA